MSRRVACVQNIAADTAASTAAESAVQRLSWRGFAVGKNFSNRRRKVINACARHDDAVPAAMSFLCDTQKSATLIFPELDVEVLALNLQFFRLDDVIHFALRAPSLGCGTLRWKKNQRLLGEFLTLRQGWAEGGDGRLPGVLGYAGRVAVLLAQSTL